MCVTIWLSIFVGCDVRVVEIPPEEIPEDE